MKWPWSATASNQISAADIAKAQAQMMAQAPSPGWGYTSTSAYIGAPPTMQLPKMKIVEQQEPMTGWRFYSFDNGKLTGGYGNTWTDRHFKATCNNGNDIERLILYHVPPEVGGKLAAYYRELTNQPAAEELCVKHLEAGTCASEPGCGIWATAEPMGHGMIVARCIAYGTVLADDEGNWRSSEAQIEELFILRDWLTRHSDPYVISGLTGIKDFIDYDRMAEILTTNYFVPVKVVDTMEEISVKSLPVHGG